MTADIFAGVTGGIAVCFIGHPFDTTKTRMQVAKQNYYTSTIDCIRKTLKSEGWRGFYSGMSSPLLGQMIFRGVSFSTYFSSENYISNYFDKIDDNNNISPSSSTTSIILAGGFTGFVISFIECPIDLIKTKLQIQIYNNNLNIPSSYNSMSGCVRYNISKYGIRSLFQGLQGTLIRNIPANALFFPVFELTKRQFAKIYNCEKSELPTIASLLSGSVAGLSYWVTTYPLDVIKGQLQAQSNSNRMTWLNTAKSMYQIGN
jgi:solute carrier family 25 carnitine/acylcarnitine transporter 20/29